MDLRQSFKPSSDFTNSPRPISEIQSLQRKAVNAHIYRGLAVCYMLVPYPLWSYKNMQGKQGASELSVVSAAGVGNK